MTLSAIDTAILVGVVAVCTFVTRAVPFVLFGGNEQVPGRVQYLGRVLPPAVIATLIVYCLRNVEFGRYPGGMAELIAIAVVVVLHLWKRSSLLSIGAGTALYMVLVQVVFV